MPTKPKEDFGNNKNRNLDSEQEKFSELTRRKNFLEKQQKLLNHKIEVLKQANKELENKLLDDTKYRDEFDQIKNELKGVTKILDSKFEKLEKDTKKINNKIKTHSKTFEIIKSQQKTLSTVVNSNNQNKFSRNNLSLVAVSYLVVAILFTSYSFYTFDVIQENNYMINELKPFQSGFLIENLQGETINTWVSWRLVEHDVLHVNIVDGEKYPDKVDVIKNTILSNEGVQIDDAVFEVNSKGTVSTYYKGWSKALETASAFADTKFYIPTQFQIVESDKGEGDITIRLTNLSHGDGLSGETRLIADAQQNQIVKARITIYDINDLTDVELSTIVRHEFGHAIGLAHSSDPNDLMHEKIKTKYPYVSECDIDAIVSLYDGGKLSKVVCER